MSQWCINVLVYALYRAGQDATACEPASTSDDNNISLGDTDHTPAEIAHSTQEDFFRDITTPSFPF